MKQVSRMNEAIESNVLELYWLLATEARVTPQFREIIAVTGITQHRYRHRSIGVTVWLSFKEVNRSIVACSVGHKEVPFPAIKDSAIERCNNISDRLAGV